MSRAEFTYKHEVWGEIILATKEQIQSFGIGAGLLFPGDPDGPKRVIEVVDPRGYKAEISEHWDGLHNVRITYPGREYNPRAFTTTRSDSAHLKTTRALWGNEYLGSAEALIDAGLIQRHQLPGQPGRPKVRVKLLPDGTVATRANPARSDSREGEKVIIKASKTTFLVVVSISDDESARRADEARAHYAEWANQWLDQPRPAPLHAVYREMKRLALLPRAPRRSESAEAFRADLNGLMGIYLMAIRDRCEDATYRVSAKAMADFESAAKQLENVFLNAEIVSVDATELEPGGILHSGFWLRAV